MKRSLFLSLVVAVVALNTSNSEARTTKPSEVCRIALMTDDEVGSINSVLNYQPQHTHEDPIGLTLRGPRGVFEMRVRFARKIVPIAEAVGVDIQQYLDPQSTTTFEDFVSDVSEKLNDMNLSPVEVLREMAGDNPYLNHYADSFETQIADLGAKFSWSTRSNPSQRTLPERPGQRVVAVSIESLLYDDAASALTVEIAHQINHAASILPEPNYIETFPEFVERTLSYFIQVEARAALISLQIKTRLMDVTIHPEAVFYTDLEEEMLKINSDPFKLEWTDLLPLVRNNLKSSLNGEIAARWIKYWVSQDSIKLNAGLDSALSGHVATDEIFIGVAFSVSRASPLWASLPPHMKDWYSHHLISYLLRVLRKDGQAERADRLESLAVQYGFQIENVRNPLENEFFALKLMIDNPLVFSTILVDQEGQMRWDPN